MVLLDLFSGYGGFHKGFENAGIEFDEAYFSEIDKHAIANYKYNFTNSKFIGDVRANGYKYIARPDIITFGSPCQNFSTLGNRKGLGGAKSSLIEKAITIVDYLRPTVFVWENVKGAASTNGGADFIEILKRFAEIGMYELQGGLVNSLQFTPQNRERYFIIGYIAGQCGGEVFPFRADDKVYNGWAGKKMPPTAYSTTIKRCFGNKRDDTYIRERDGRLRRLTEIECERLQGLPDDWTRYGVYGGSVKEVPMTQRYNLIGNGVNVAAVTVIAKSILSNVCLL